MAGVGTRLRARFLAALDPGHDHVALREGASEVLRREVGADVAIWATVDPATVMWTSCVLDGMPRDEDLENAIFHNEYVQTDVLRLVDLAAGPHVGTLHHATDGRPDTSARFRDLLAPAGFTDELRLVFHDGTTAWGALDLLRSDGIFGSDEVAAVADVGRPFATALRAALLRSTVCEEPDPATFPLGVAGSGLVLCTADGRPLEVSDEARALLGPTPELPQAVQAVVAARRTGSATAAAPTREGRWLTFHATPLAGHVAVVVEEVRPRRLAEIVMRSRGLSPRERDVLSELSRGHSNRRIARSLGLSEWTVQDHVKAVFVKFGVSSRNELVAALFFGHYAPLHAGDVPG